MIDKDGTILNTGVKGRSTRTACVGSGMTVPVMGFPWHNLVDADTLRETITRLDGRGREDQFARSVGRTFLK